MEIPWKILSEKEKQKYINRAKLYIDMGIFVGYNNSIELAKELYYKTQD